MRQDDYPEWKQSQYKQLDQYETQGMFGEPMQMPTGAGASFMLWTYLIKMCGTKKAPPPLPIQRFAYFSHTFCFRILFQPLPKLSPSISSLSL
jgi:hypothetical protein